MILEFVIASICASPGSIPKDACSKSLEAAAVQSEVKPKVATGEKIIEKDVVRFTGENVWIAGGVAQSIYKKQINYGFDTKSIGIDRTNVSIGVNHNGLGFSWDF